MAKQHCNAHKIIMSLAVREVVQGDTLRGTFDTAGLSLA